MEEREWKRERVKERKSARDRATETDVQPSKTLDVMIIPRQDTNKVRHTSASTRDMFLKTRVIRR
jgi:hypothetical protein